MKHFFFVCLFQSQSQWRRHFAKAAWRCHFALAWPFFSLACCTVLVHTPLHMPWEKERPFISSLANWRARVRSHRPFFIFIFRISFSFAGWCGANDVHTMYTRIRHNDEAWIHAPMATTDSQSTANYVQEKLCSVLISASLMDLRCEIFCHFIYLFRCFFIRAQNQPVRRFLPGDFKQRRHHSIVMYIHFHK